jgi:hypothetical protein
MLINNKDNIIFKNVKWNSSVHKTCFELLKKINFGTYIIKRRTLYTSILFNARARVRPRHLITFGYTTVYWKFSNGIYTFKIRVFTLTTAQLQLKDANCVQTFF